MKLSFLLCREGKEFFSIFVTIISQQLFKIQIWKNFEAVFGLKIALFHTKNASKLSLRSHLFIF